MMDWQITPLHLAAKYGHFEVCQFIFENVQQARFFRTDGLIPLDLALYRGHIKAAKILIENDLDNVLDNSFVEISALFLAHLIVFLSFLSVVSLLSLCCLSAVSHCR